MSLKIYEYNRCGTCKKALKYLDINNKEESLDKECPSFTLIDSKEYYQPELLH